MTGSRESKVTVYTTEQQMKVVVSDRTLEASRSAEGSHSPPISERDASRGQNFAFNQQNSKTVVFQKTDESTSKYSAPEVKPNRHVDTKPP